MSLPTPPSGILDKDRPWYRGRISDAQWDRLKAKLTGGTDAGGTSYSKFIQCSPAEADKIIVNMKKDPRGYPQMHMPGGGESYQIMIDFYQWLKDSYSSDEPKEENIPVEVEVVEVEQKQPEEPIRVVIETPLESTPEQPLQAPKTLRLPRRSGVIRPPSKQKKKSTAERMAEAFDERLDDLVDSIQNPPAPAPPKQRKQKESLVKIRRVVAPKSKSTFKEAPGVKPFENTSLFMFRKAKNAFGRAADARRMAKEQGMPEQEKGFYVKRALGFEFGGDAIARTRGTFSSSPDATLDPSLTKQQRYMEGMFGSRTIRPPKEQKVDNEIDGITKKIAKIDKQFQDIIDTKSSTPTPQTATLEKTLEELKEKLSAGNKLQKDINSSKKKMMDLESKAADQAQAAAEETEIDKGKDLSKFEDQFEPKKKGKGGDGDDDEGGGLDIDWKKIKWSKWLRRLKNPGRFMRSIGRLGRMKLFKAKAFGSKALTGTKALGAKVVGGVKGFFAGGAAATAGIVAGAGLAASGIGEGLFQLSGKKGGMADQVIESQLKGAEARRERGDEVGATLLEFSAKKVQFEKESLKVLGNALDAIGTPFRYAIEGIRYPFLNEKDREKQAHNLAKFDGRLREYSRGWMNKIDFMNVIPDEKGGFGNIYGNDKANKEMMEKMSEGGTIPKFQGVSGTRATGDLGGTVNAMIGEAGPEMLIRDGQTSSSPVNPLQSLAPIIVALREVTKRAGTWADPVENMVRQISDPIAKSLKLPVLPMNVDIDKKTDESKTKKLTGKKGLLGKIMNFLKGGGSEEEDIIDIASDSENSVNGVAGNFPGGAKGVLDLIASVEAPDYDTFNQSRGRTEGKATEKTIMWLHQNANGAIGRYQHMPQFILERAQRYGIPVNSLFTPEVQDLMTVKMMEEQHGLNEFLSGQMPAEEFAGKLSATWRGLPQGPRNAARLGGTADSTYNDGTDNAAGMLWADAVASLKGIQSGGTTSAPPAPGGSQIRAVGDSLAQGVADSSVALDNATEGHSPAAVLNTISRDINRSNTSSVVLSTGLSNNPAMLSQAEQSMASLDRQGIQTVVLPVSDNISRNNNNLNAKIQAMAAKYPNVTYAGNVQGFSTNDQIHPSSYSNVVRKLRLAAN